MKYATLKIDEEKEAELLNYYRQIINNKAKEKIYSLADFKKTEIYEDLSDEEKEDLDAQDEKDVQIFVFETAEQALAFIDDLRKGGLIDQEQAEENIARINAQEAASNRPRM